MERTPSGTQARFRRYRAWRFEDIAHLRHGLDAGRYRACGKLGDVVENGVQIALAGPAALAAASCEVGQLGDTLHVLRT